MMRFQWQIPWFLSFFILWYPAVLFADESEYVEWQAVGDAIPEPLGGLQGDPVRGKAVVIDRDSGNCLACHHMPIPEEPMHGTVAPPLDGVGSRLSEGQLRLRVVNEQRINPNTIMPALYKRPGEYHRPHPAYKTTVLTAQEVEDVVAYLMTLK
ncbi:sulfur oxidation c-type cytochrome SoxX [Thiohalophilus sp.]|uniref:sulfur oxidation c-type cytochrome SoxX n=1 Tax=Thiohalophilus sp. TaxID=3028392 RepID=UPI002ACD7969|nr:sulfur oxidation c-type cytochrome SoxX [Thiohalophilus sp.]MDZ7802601.1 sulfur oxidation c-type cytochrome SoxX [Thiohalophilus sp.]